jgi:aminoglycoside 3'-phosphotransferase I
VADDITAEMVRLKWLARFVPVPQVQAFFYSADQAWLLTTALSGRSAYDSLVSDPDGRLGIVRALAEFVHELHSLPVCECPFNSDHQLRMAEARRNMESGQVDESDFDSGHKDWTAEQVWTEMQALLPLPFDRVVTHGDFSLGNIFVQNGRVTGCIDVGRVGVADPYQDLAILWHNLEEFGGDLQTSLFQAYGITDPDARKVQYHLCLDELF